MFGNSKPIAFDPYGRRRSRWRLPRWLILLLVGMTLGAAAVLFVQERYLPPRLSAADSAALRQAFDEAESERQRLKIDVTEASKGLESAQAARKESGDELAASRATVKSLRDEVRTLVEALPPDPRGGSVAVRAARFSAKGGQLEYDVVLTRERATGAPLGAVMQLVLSGEAARGGDSTVALKPVPVSIGSHDVVQGTLDLPEGFKPRQATVQVLDRPGGRSLGMRVLFVK